MTKQQVINQIVNNTCLREKAVRLVVDSFIKVVKNAVDSNEIVTIRGFGNFYLKFVKEHEAQHIRAKKRIVVPSHYVPKFKPSDEFKDVVNYQKEAIEVVPVPCAKRGDTYVSPNGIEYIVYDVEPVTANNKVITYKYLVYRDTKNRLKKIKISQKAMSQYVAKKGGTK